ncbi:uncharacterized protein LOC108600938 [Drosophila busckii]|uniref:uncharacterized protein LOC108600938 n=1 Tax=Drosophila busckii TaxID=30019 RepID=UPI00083F334B|nr:uncharacterized protein LOC108600938 [Drosophila busckii]
MRCLLLRILGALMGFDFVCCNLLNDNYEVVGMACANNEEVSCMIADCPTSEHCPAANFCYNPKCVCRRGFRKVEGRCVKRHATPLLKQESINSALLRTYYN